MGPVCSPCQAIHAGLVRKSTFFHLDEMIRLIESSHHVSGVRGVGGVSGQHRPEMGHKVLVSNLWEVRDIWNWLAPGWSDPRTKEEARPCKQNLFDPATRITCHPKARASKNPLIQPPTSLVSPKPAQPETL